MKSGVRVPPDVVFLRLLWRVGKGKTSGENHDDIRTLDQRVESGVNVMVLLCMTLKGR